MSARTILAGLTGLFLLCLLGCGGGSASPSPAVSVSISPLAAAVAVGSTQQFTAAVSGATNQAVTWSVNGVAGGNSTVGTISISGSYTAPSTVPSPATVTVVATSQATSSAAASASVSLSYPIPSVTAVTPSSITASASGALITVTGQNFVPVSTVNLGATSLATTFVSGTQLKASVPGGTATIGGNYLVTITNPAPGGGPSTTSANLAIAPSIVSVQPANGSVGSAFSITTLGGDPSNLTNNSVAFAQTGRTFSAIVTAASKQGGGVVLTATVPAGLAPASPTALLSAPATVSMATGGVVAGSNTSFTIQPPPHAHAISPPSAEKGTSLPVALQGAFTSFDSSTRLTTDAPELLVSNITVQAPNLITANLTVAAGAAAGAHTLAATSGGASISFTFTVLAPSGNPLTLSSLSATSLAPMAPITLQGSGFAAGGQAGSSLVVQYAYGTVVAYLPATAGTDTRIDSLVPPLIDSATGQFYTGAVNVQVIVNGKASNTLGFTLIPLPPNTGAVGATTLNYVGILNSQVSNEKSLLDSLQDIPADRAAALTSLFGTLNNGLASFANNVSIAASGGTVILPDGSSFGKNEVDVLDRLLQSANVSSLSTSSMRANRLAQLSGANFQFTDLVAAGAGTTCNAADFLLNFQKPFQYASWTVCIVSLFPPAAPVLGPVCGLMKLSQGVFLAVQLVKVACDILPINLTSVAFSPATTESEPLRMPVNGASVTESAVGNFDSSPRLTSSVVTTLIDAIIQLGGPSGFDSKQVGQLFIANKVFAAVFGKVLQDRFDDVVTAMLDHTSSSFDLHQDATPLTTSTVSLQPNPNPFAFINGFTLTPELTAGRKGLYLDTSVFRALDAQGNQISPALSPFALPGNSLSVQITTVVSVLPNILSIGEGGQQPFTARVSGTPIQSVTWSVDGLQGGSSALGTISDTGLYTAPATVGSHTIAATSTFDQSSGSTTVTVAPAPTVVVSVSPTVASVATGRTQQFSPTFTGTSDTRVNWSINGTTGGNSGVGTISAAGLYTAPATVPNPATVIVTATSTAFPSASGAATATIVPAVPPGTIMTVAGGNSLCPQWNDQVGDGCPSTSAFLSWPWATAADADGNLYISDTYTERIRAVNTQPTAIAMVGVTIPPGTIATVVGTGAEGSLGDSGPATSAELNSPAYVALDAAGNLYVADYSNNVIRVVNTQSSPITVAQTTIQPGDIATVAGGGKGCSGQTDNVGDNCPATSAVLNSPVTVILDKVGNMYICEFYGLRVRKVDATTGLITTMAGDGFWLDKPGDGGPATSAELNDPAGIALDGAGNLYISEYWGGRVRRVDPKTGLISTVAGNGTLGSSGDGGPATSAEVGFSWGLAVDAQGNLYIADSGNHAIRVVNMQSSTISVAATSISPGNIAKVAGNGSLGYSGDGGAATSARLSGPRGVFVDGKGNLYIADTGNNVVRRVAGN